MSSSARGGKAIDAIQERLADYALDLSYEKLSVDAVHAAKTRLIDTLAALFGGFFEELNRVARNVAAAAPSLTGATVLGTRIKTLPDLAAFANATAARCVEMNDSYHWPGSAGGHPSDVVMPVLAVAEHVKASGCDLVGALVLGYEIFCRISNASRNPNFDPTNFSCLAVAIASSKLMKLSREQTAHAISMSVVPNNCLRQVRRDTAAMFKSAQSGQAGRAGVFAAILARAGMEGPHLPFEGKAGWCDQVVKNRFVLDEMGGGNTPFKICDAHVKFRASCGTAISSVLAAEKVAPIAPADVKRVVVEVYKDAKERCGTGDHRWNPDSRESADHSIPYNVAATLMEGTVTPRSFNDAHLWNPELRTLMAKVEVVESPEFTQYYGRQPVEHHTRVTITRANGEQLVGKSGGGHQDMGSHKGDADIEQKFLGMADDCLGHRRAQAVLKRLWRLDELDNVAALPAEMLIT